MADQYGSKQELCDTMLDIPSDSSPDVYMKTFASFTMSFWGTSFCSCFYNTACLGDEDRFYFMIYQMF